RRVADREAAVAAVDDVDVADEGTRLGRDARGDGDRARGVAPVERVGDDRVPVEADVERGAADEFRARDAGIVADDALRRGAVGALGAVRGERQRQRDRDAGDGHAPAGESASAVEVRRHTVAHATTIAGRPRGVPGRAAMCGKSPRPCAGVLVSYRFPISKRERSAPHMATRSDVRRGTLDLMILRTLELRPMHGYGIARRLDQVTGGAARVSPGSLFPALYRLEHSGWVRGKWGESENGRRARFYSLTAAGRRQ